MVQFEIKEVYVNKQGEAVERQIVQIGQNDVLRIFEVYKGLDLEDFIEEIIKVDLPSSETEALNLLHNGIEFDGNRYVTLATTVGLMKKQSIDNIDYSAEYFFIREDYKDFVEEFEDVVSLGKLKTKEDTTLCINKDIVSRLSLAFSTGDRVHIPGIKKAILPEMSYKYVNNYLQFAEKEMLDDEGNVVLDKKGKPKKVIDLDFLRLEEHANLEVKHIAMDGSGFIMPNLIDKIGKQLNVRYPLSWIGIREIGVASKGLLVKFDFKKYLKDEHGLDKLIVKDMWGHDVDLFEVDVIQNESQVKWGKWFKNYGEIESLINKEKYNSYRHLFEGFNIVKYNKENPTPHTESNYQIITNLALTPNELEQLSKESEQVYNKVINRDVDITRLMLGDIARDESTVLSASTKLHKLLQLDPGFINIQSMKKVRESLINKKVNNLAGGGLYLRGNYKVILKDAISYFDSIVNQKYEEGKLIGFMSQSGLQNNTNYVPGELGKRVLARCPLNSATEIVKTELVQNNLYDKYFGQLSSDICFYPFNDFMMRQSGADEDLDITFVIDEDIIYNAAIEDIDENGNKWYFRNQFDGGSSEDVFTKNELYKAVIRCRGNAIGELSNKGAIISNLMQEMPYLRVSDDKISSETLLAEKVDINEVRALLKQGLEDGIYKDYTDIEDEKIREFIKSNFNKYKMYSYFTLYLQMVAIDSPKTNIKVTEEETNIIDELIKGKRNPRYIYYAKYKTKNKTVKYKDTSYSNTLLNNHCNRIIVEFGHKAREMENKNYKNKRLYDLLIENNDSKLNVDLVVKLGDLNNEYNLLRDSIEVKKEIDLIKTKMKSENNELKYMQLKDKLYPLYEVRDEEYNKIDVVIANKYNQLKQGYAANEVLKALNEVRSYANNKISSRFIIEFCFEEVFNHILAIKGGNLATYKLEIMGDIRFLYNNYIKVDTNKISDDNLSEKDLAKKKEKLGQIKICRLGNLTYSKLTNKVEIKGKQVYNSGNELIGKLFKKDIEDGIYEVEKYDYTTATNKDYNTAKSLGITVVTA